MSARIVQHVTQNGNGVNINARTIQGGFSIGDTYITQGNAGASEGIRIGESEVDDAADEETIAGSVNSETGTSKVVIQKGKYNVHIG